MCDSMQMTVLIESVNCNLQVTLSHINQTECVHEFNNVYEENLTSSTPAQIFHMKNKFSRSENLLRSFAGVDQVKLGPDASDKTGWQSVTNSRPANCLLRRRPRQVILHEPEGEPANIAVVQSKLPKQRTGK